MIAPATGENGNQAFGADHEDQAEEHRGHADAQLCARGCAFLPPRIEQIELKGTIECETAPENAGGCDEYAAGKETEQDAKDEIYQRKEPGLSVACIEKSLHGNSSIPYQYSAH